MKILDENWKFEKSVLSTNNIARTLGKEEIYGNIIKWWQLYVLVLDLSFYKWH